jgi:thioredoxin 1
MAGTILDLTDQSWEAEVMASSQAVLVDFWAAWCVPCKTMLPSIEAVARQFDGRLKVAKLNVEENAQVAYRYNITTLPTLMVFKAGQVAEQRMGLVSRENLIKLLEPHLA